MHRKAGGDRALNMTKGSQAWLVVDPTEWQNPSADT